MTGEALPILRLLRLSAGSHVVFQTRVGGELAVARVLARPVPLELDEPVRRSVFKASEPPPGLTPEQASFLAGGRARASLGATRGLPELLAAGVVPLELPGLVRAGRGEGHLHLLTRWVEGRTLGDAAPMALAVKLQVLGDLAVTLERIHAGLVAHGGLAPRDLVYDGESLWLVETAALRAVRAGDPRLAGDVFAFGQLARSLLAGEHLPAASRWPAAILACLAADPAARPTMSQLVAGALLAADESPAGETIHVADPTVYRAPAARRHAIDPPTERVADPVAPPRDGSPALFVLIASLVVAAFALLGLLSDC